MQGWVTSRGGPDADITLNLDLLRQRSRDLCMGEPLAIGALKTIRVNEIGAGLKLNAQVDADFLGLSDEEALAWEEHRARVLRCGPTRRVRRRAPHTSASSWRWRACRS
jgi:hypothetical protein